MNNKSLVQIANEVTQLEVMLIESEGAITPEIEEALSVKEIELPEKVDNYSFVQARLDMAVAMYKEQAKKYAQAAKYLENAQERLEERLKFGMTTLGVSELNGNTVRYTLKPTAGSLVIDDEEAIPLAFKTEVSVTTIDKATLKTALKTEQIPGAHIEPGLTLRKFVSTKLIKGGKDE